MAAYLGTSGSVEIRRDNDGEALIGAVNPADVNPGRRRFSFDFEPGAIVTGDKLEIVATDGQMLSFVSPTAWIDGQLHPDGKWFVSVDEVGGLRLYDTFEDAIEGDQSSAIELVEITAPIAVQVTTRNLLYRCLAQISDFSITTNRETVDITTLGEEFRQQYAAGLISGQGELNCIWDYRRAMCDPAFDGKGNTPEVSHYLAQLVVLMRQGADFIGRFYLHNEGPQLVWYDARCVVTNTAMAFGGSDVVRCQAEFITSGPIALRMGKPPAYLLQENSNLLLSERGDGYPLELE
jgi:hypothetical protein